MIVVMAKKKTKRQPKYYISDAWETWPLKHTTLVAIVLVLFISILDTVIVRTFFEFSTSLGLASAFIAGMFYVSLFTAAPAVIMLAELSKTIDTIPLILFASIGSVVGDLIILKIFRDNIYEEMKYLGQKLGIGIKIKKSQRKAVSWLMALVGIFVLGSPLPDEVGIAMLGMTQYSKARILLVAFVANFVGIAIIVFAARAATN
jgi:hypothetical protein